MQDYETFVYYDLITDKGQYKITQKQKDMIIHADKLNARFIEIDDAVINIAFIREMKRVESLRYDFDLDEFPITNEERKYLIEREKDDNLAISN